MTRLPDPSSKRGGGGLCAGVLMLLLAAGEASAQDGVVRERVLVRFHAGVSHAQRSAALAATRSEFDRVLPDVGVMVLRVPAGAEAAVARALANRPEVEFAEPDLIYAPQGVPNDPQYANQWHLPKIQAPAAWDVTTGSDALIIAVLDTGIDASHPDLAPRLVPGWNVVDGNSNTSDVHGHGTAVAGTAAAVGNNGIGVAGVAYSCRIMPVRVSSNGDNGCTSASHIASGLTWAANRGARVANISYAASMSSTVRSAAQYFQNTTGGVVAVSAGNQATFYPDPDNPYVLTVSATDGADNLASFSNTGNNIDLAAPGVSIRTTARGGGYSSWSGTSFSAPVVAGVAALALSANPALTPAQVQEALTRGADDRGAAGWDTRFGWGRVNAAATLSLAQTAPTGGSGGSTPPPQRDTTPPSITITSPAPGATVDGNVAVTVSAFDNVGVVRVELFVDGQYVANATSEPFTVRWNARRAPSGPHTLQCLASDAAGNIGASPVVTVVK